MLSSLAMKPAVAKRMAAKLRLFYNYKDEGFEGDDASLSGEEVDARDYIKDEGDDTSLNGEEVEEEARDSIKEEELSGTEDNGNGNEDNEDEDESLHMDVDEGMAWHGWGEGQEQEQLWSTVPQRDAAARAEEKMKGSK